MTETPDFHPLKPDPRFFATAPGIRAIDATSLAGAKIVHSDTDTTEVTHATLVTRAGAGAVVFVENGKVLDDLSAGEPALVFTKDNIVEQVLRVFPDASIATTPVPKAAYAAVARALHHSLDDTAAQGAGVSPDARVAPTAKISPSAIVMPGAEVGENVIIGPYTVVGVGVAIGDESKIGAHCTIRHAKIGRHCHFSSGVRVGEKGFGYANDGSGAQPVPQLGRVLIGDWVDLGANTVVDRGAIDDTEIGDGTKIDNLVQIAHNCKIGRHVLIASQTGISGSCNIGDGVMMGGQAGMADHLDIGAGAIISAKSGLMKDVPPGERWGGIPAKPAREWMKDVAAVSKLTRKGKK